MCGRYTIFQVEDTDAIEDRFGATPDGDLMPRYNAAPSQDLPVITNERRGTIDQLQWGLIPSWADDPTIGNKLINARAETVAEKPSFRDAYEHRRCLVLADGFYEWAETSGDKQPYRVTRTDEDLFAMAGLWARWTSEDMQAGLDAFAGGNDGGGSDNSDGERGDGAHEPDTRETFTIVTTEPNGVVGEIHDRMPVVLARGEEDRWLHGDSGDVAALLDPYPAERTRAYPVSTAVNDPSNDTPAVVAEVDASA